MLRKISPLSILVGFLASQAIAMLASIFFIVFFFLIYGNRAFVAFFEPPAVAITMFVSLLVIISGGYTTMLLRKKSYINPFLFGVISLALNTWAMWAFDFQYGAGHEWILFIGGILTIPSALFGAYLYQRKSS